MPLKGELPLKVNDSEDMVIYGLLQDALSIGWAPSNLMFAKVKAETKEEIEPAMSSVPSIVPELVAPLVEIKAAPTVVQPKGRHYRGVRRRP
ncbi:Ethylene-responsive transcription factor 1 [Capsicum annuum]|nr:Ethylene-responsive transcription factor 1 [Capsicum annuum]